MTFYAGRKPSLTETPDQFAVLCSADDGTLPERVEQYSLAALLAWGYAEPHADRFRLTPAGLDLRARWREISDRTAAAMRPRGPLTPPSPAEQRDARAAADADYLTSHGPDGRELRPPRY